MTLVEQGDPSVQIVRQALPQMSRHGIPITPSNYAVWFTYLKGGDGSLKEEMDAALEGDGPTVAQVEDFYRRYVDTGDAQALERLREGLRGLLSSFGDTLSGAGAEMSDYAESLSELSTKLAEDVPARELAEVVDALSRRTAEVVRDMTSLRAEVEQAVQDVDALAPAAAPATGGAGQSREAFEAAFAAIAEGALERDTHRPCLVLLELDASADVAAEHGEAALTALADRVSHVLAETLTEDDVLARLDTTRFGVLLNDVRASAATEIAESLRAAVAGATTEWAGAAAPLRTTLSGGAAFLREGEGLDELTERADSVLFLSAESGGNCITIDH